MIVVDAHVIAAMWLKLSYSEDADRCRSKDPNWIVPPLWRSEFRSVLRQHILIGQLRYSRALWFAKQAEHMLRYHEREVDTPAVLKLVEQTGHSSYDCEYVALAQTYDVQLVTTDKQVLRLFPDTAVALSAFA